MPAGGARMGAGRPKGSKNDKTKTAEKVARELQEKYAHLFSEDEINEMTPIGCLLMGMKLAIKAGDWKTACERAIAAAPYYHPKLSSSEIKSTVENKFAELSDERLDAILSMIDERVNGPVH